MAGKLYLVGTPIGNLGDLSPRAAETLGAVDFVAAEDTRVTLKLLTHLGLKKPLVSFYEHNQGESGPKILSRLLAGESCALVTDAGMPAISDPGEGLVRLCAEAGVEVLAVPGPTAATTALALSALSTARFVFEGFLPVPAGERSARLAELRTERRTLVLYEAPHKLAATLEDLLEVLGDRKISLCRELTKLHEETVRTTLREAAAYYAENAPRGEFVLVIEGAAGDDGPSVTLEEAAVMVQDLQDQGMRLKDAVKRVSQRTGVARNALYDAAVSQEE